VHRVFKRFLLILMIDYCLFFFLAAIGASGSLYGLMVFLIVDRIIALRINPGRRFFIIIQLALLLFPHIISIIPMIIKYNVAHSAHIGGGFVGFLLGIGMIGCLPPWNNENGIGRTACQRTAFIFLILYYVITFASFFLSYAPIVHSISKNQLDYKILQIIEKAMYNRSNLILY